MSLRDELLERFFRYVAVESQSDASATTLPSTPGQQKLADLAMTLMPDPDVILLDEPMAGVNPALIEELVERISTLNAQGKTFVIIEHNLKVVMDLCDWLVVLDHGVKLAEGTPGEIQNNNDVLEAYFGS